MKAGVIALCAAAAVALWLRWPRRIDAALGRAQTIYQARAGTYAVEISVQPRSSGDSGAADMSIATAATRVSVATTFNYDTLQDQPAGTWHLAWIDGDVWPDVVVATGAPPSSAYVVGSRDGSVRETSDR